MTSDLLQVTTPKLRLPHYRLALVLLIARDADCIRNYQKPKKYPEVSGSTVATNSAIELFTFLVLYGYKLDYVKKLINILYLKYCQGKITLLKVNYLTNRRFHECKII